MRIRPVKPVSTPARQHGAITVLTFFILLMTIGALGVLGLGQVVWEREQIQRMADLVAKVAASDIDGAAGGFQVAREHAARNGFNPASDSIEISCNVKGTDLPLSSANCQLSVLVKVTRNVPAAFLGTEPVTAVAEATVSPVVSGIVGTSLLRLNLDNSTELPPLIKELGAKLSLEAVSFRGLLRSNLEVDLQKLARALAVPGSNGNFNLGNLLNTQVSARQLIDRASEVAGFSGTSVGNMNSPSLGTTFPLSRLISGQQAVNANVPAASVRLGDLVFAATLSAASFLSEGTIQLDLGNTVRVSVLQPPQIFLAVKSPSSTGVLTTARTEQIKLTTKINGVVDLAVVAGGGEVDIREIECRLPQSRSVVESSVRSSVVELALDLPSLSSVNALGFILGPLVDTPVIEAKLTSQSASGLRLEGYPSPILQSAYSFEAQQGLPNLLSQIDLGLAPLQPLLTVLSVNSPVRNALSGLGQQVDGLLGFVGLDVNEVVVQVNRMDCFKTAVITR